MELLILSPIVVLLIFFIREIFKSKFLSNELSNKPRPSRPLTPRPPPPPPQTPTSSNSFPQSEVTMFPPKSSYSPLDISLNNTTQKTKSIDKRNKFKFITSKNQE